MPAEPGTLELSVTIGNSAFSASGDAQVVLDLYADFKEFVRATPVLLPAGSESGSSSGSDEAAGSAESDAESGPTEVKAPTSLPLKPYLARLKLRGNKEKATAIVAWSGESGEKAALTVGQIEQLWKKTPFRAPANLARDVRAAEAEGWLDSQGKPGSPDMTYSINGYGEGIVAGWVTKNEE